MGIFDNYKNSDLLNFCVRHSTHSRIASGEIYEMIMDLDEKERFEHDIEALKKKILAEYKFPKKLVETFFENDEILVLNNDGKRITIGINIYILFYMLYINLINYENDKDFIKTINDAQDLGDITEQLIQKFREARRKLVNIKDDDEFNQYINENTFFMAMVAEKLADIPVTESISKKDILQIGNNQFTDNIFAIRHFARNIGRFNIDIDRYESIDKDHFMFYIATKVLHTLYEKKEVDNAIYFCINYYLRVKDKIDKDYTIYIRAYDPREGDYSWYIYTFANFISELQDYMLKHPEIRMETVSEDFFDENWTIKEIDEYFSELNRETMEYFEAVNPVDVFLPYGENESNPRTPADPSKVTKSRKPKNEVTTLILEKRAFYARNLGKIHKTLLGKDRFLGYIANIFNNGYVIFEKYDVNLGLVSTKPGAAYIMTIDNFEKLCTLTITEIRNISRLVKNDPNSGFGFVDYKCHSGKWQEYLQSYIDADTGIDLSEEGKRKTLCQPIDK